jgi:hypothetical protein
MWKIQLAAKASKWVVLVYFFSFKEKTKFTNKFKKQIHMQTKCRYLRSTSFTPEYSATDLVVLKCTEPQYKFVLIQP